MELYRTQSSVSYETASIWLVQSCASCVLSVSEASQYPAWKASLWDGFAMHDRHPLLLTPGNMVSITNAILYGKRPFAVTKLVKYQSPLPSSWRPWRSYAPDRLLLPLPIGPKVPRHQANYSPPCCPQRSQAPSQPGGANAVTEQGSPAEHDTLSIKSSSYKPKVGLEPEPLLECKPCDPW